MLYLFSLISLRGRAKFLFFLQPLRHIRRKVRNNHISTCSSYPSQYLHHHAFFVDPAVLGGGFDHGELATDVVGGDWQVAGVAYLADDVEVGHGGLDHDDIGTFRDIQVNFA